MVLPPAPFKKWRTCPRCLPASKKSPQNPSISLALRPETIRHPDKRSKLENGATCGLAQLKKEISQLNSAIFGLIEADQSLSRQSQLLCSIPGIAQLTAAKLLAELAGKEFASARQLAAYAGLTPAECRSGGSFYGQTHLSKIGNAFLRKALYMPAAVARRWCAALKPWVALLERRKLHDLAIRGAIMRKLLHIAFGVLKHQQPFNPALVFIPKTV